MGAASREYCKKTPVSKMGFTQKSSCKAQGIIPRTSKEARGKKVVSPKYRMSTLYSPGKGKPRVKTGYKDEATARMTLKNISGREKSYQKQVVTTMYNRAKHHPYQSKEMRQAMKIYREWMRKHSVNFSSNSR